MVNTPAKCQYADVIVKSLIATYNGLYNRTQNNQVFDTQLKLSPPQGGSRGGTVEKSQPCLEMVEAMQASKQNEGPDPTYDFIQTLQSSIAGNDSIDVQNKAEVFAQLLTVTKLAHVNSPLATSTYTYVKDVYRAIIENWVQSLENGSTPVKIPDLKIKWPDMDSIIAELYQLIDEDGSGFILKSAIHSTKYNQRRGITEILKRIDEILNTPSVDEGFKRKLRNIKTKITQNKDYIRQQSAKIAALHLLSSTSDAILVECEEFDGFDYASLIVEYNIQSKQFKVTAYKESWSEDGVSRFSEDLLNIPELSKGSLKAVTKPFGLFFATEHGEFSQLMSTYFWQIFAMAKDIIREQRKYGQAGFDINGLARAYGILQGGGGGSVRIPAQVRTQFHIPKRLTGQAAKAYLEAHSTKSQLAAFLGKSSTTTLTKSKLVERILTRRAS